MRGVNKVIIVGILGQDPEVRYSQAGVCFANISVATSESWKDKVSGEKQERTEWHKITFAARLAEVVGEYLRKGSKIYVEGSLCTRKWQAQDGTDRYTTEIKAREMQMLDGRESGQSAPQQQYPAHNATTQQAGAKGGQYYQSPPQGMGDFDDDDIPF